MISTQRTWRVKTRDCCRRIGVSSLTLIALVFADATAHAYCPAAACDPSRGEVCNRDADGCVVGHALLFWQSSCLSFAVQRNGSPKNQIGADEFESVVRGAFATWTAADCGAGRHPALAFEDLGKIQCDLVEHNADRANANLFVFRDDTWPDAEARGDTFGLTTVHYNADTGQIWDVDVEINGTLGNITDADPEDGADLPSIVTHEVGHFLGLDHTRDDNGVMFPTYAPGGAALRVLAPDDVNGICHVFPPNRYAESNDCRPQNGFSAVCGSEQKQPLGCAFAGQSRAPVKLATLVATLLASVTLIRRRLRA